MRPEFGREADFTFETPSLPATTLAVLKLKGREALSQPFWFELELISTDATLELDPLVGQPGTLMLHGLAQVRSIFGVIERVELLRVGRKYTHYGLRLVPTLSFMRYTSDLRIFQQKTTREIVEEVVKTAGFDASLLTWSLIGSYTPRDYCVQYRESDWDFISRLLEEEGIFYYFQHAEPQEKLILGDHPAAHRTLPNAQTLPFRDEARVSVLQEESVHALRATAAMASGKSTLRDYRFKHPSLNMEVSRSAARFAGQETYDYPGEYVDPGLGKRLVKVRLEEQQAQRAGFQGSSTCRHLQPGYKLTLENHPRSECNGALVLRQVSHTGTQPQVLEEESGAGQVEHRGYEARFEGFKAEQVFRPPRTTPRPLVGGLQPALVVGPAGQEIYCDEHGRVKVQLYWDREGKQDEHSSCWVRVSHPWAGQGFGMVSLPRIGQEVLVQFLDGDPDRPVIVGRVYNAENPLPYPLPADKTRSTWKSNSSPGGGGSNELRFEDLKGKEEVYLHAQKDFNEVTENDHSTLVKHDETCTVDNDRTHMVHHNESITIDVDQKTVVGQHRTEQVGVNETITIGANRTEQVGANETITIGANRTEQVGANETISVGANRTEQVGANETISVGGARTLTVALAEAETIGLAKALTIGGAYQVTVGAAMNTTVGLSQSEQVMINKSVSVGNRLEIVCGKSRIVMEESGKVSIEGTEFNFAASGPVSIQGKEIDLN